jgi:hypothetical protein
MPIEIDGWELTEEHASAKGIRQANKRGAQFIRRNLDDSLTFSSAAVADVPPAVARWLMAPRTEER